MRVVIQLEDGALPNAIVDSHPMQNPINRLLRADELQSLADEASKILESILASRPPLPEILPCPECGAKAEYEMYGPLAIECRQCRFSINPSRKTLTETEYPGSLAYVIESIETWNRIVTVLNSAKSDGSNGDQGSVDIEPEKEQNHLH